MKMDNTSGGFAIPCNEGMFLNTHNFAAPIEKVLVVWKIL